MNTIYKELRSETTHETLADMERYEDMYFATIIQYINRYLWKIVDFVPEKDNQIWDMYQGHPREYSTAIRIRDASIRVGNEMKRNFLIGTQGRTNFSALDYIRRLQMLGIEKGGLKCMMIEWKEVRIGYNCSMALLQLQTITNVIQAAEEGKYHVARDAHWGEETTTRTSSIR